VYKKNSQIGKVLSFKDTDIDFLSISSKVDEDIQKILIAINEIENLERFIELICLEDHDREYS